MRTVTPDAPMVVADTNIISYIASGSPIAELYLPHLQGARIHISFQTVQEAWYGAYKDGWGERRQRGLAQQLGQYQVVWPSMDLVRISAGVRAQRHRVGRPLGVADAWIAATALDLGCPLVSHDGDFVDIPNLELIRVATA